MNERPNKPDSANPAIALWLAIEDQSRRVADLERSKSMSRVFTGVNGGNGEGTIWDSPFSLLPPVSHRDWLVPGCRTGLEPSDSNQPDTGNAGITTRLAIGHYWPGVPDPGRSL